MEVSKPKHSKNNPCGLVFISSVLISFFFLSHIYQQKKKILRTCANCTLIYASVLKTAIVDTDPVNASRKGDGY